MRGPGWHGPLCGASYGRLWQPVRLATGGPRGAAHCVDLSHRHQGVTRLPTYIHMLAFRNHLLHAVQCIQRILAGRLERAGVGRCGAGAVPDVVAPGRHRCHGVVRQKVGRELQRGGHGAQLQGRWPGQEVGTHTAAALQHAMALLVQSEREKG